MFDVAIIGAGLAGLTCAQQLYQAGYRVVVVEKSRGVGGRVATRRLHNTRADHGLPCLQTQGKLSQQLIEILVQSGILQTWTDTIYELNVAKPESSVFTRSLFRGIGGEQDVALQLNTDITCYIAPTGMTAVTKFLTTGLDIWLNHRVEAMTLTQEQTWHLTCDASDDIPKTLIAKSVVVAIPAPQALMLLEPIAEMGLSPEFLNRLRSVEFNPCLSVIAGYPVGTRHELPLPTWKACRLLNDADLSWINLDSSKRSDNETSIFVLHSTAEFAQQYLDVQDLNPAGQRLLSRAAQLLIPALDIPAWFQVHRWRYAFPSQPLHQDYLDAETSLPLICCGDWCGGSLIESAMNSGLAAASQINGKLQQRPLPGERFWTVL